MILWGENWYFFYCNHVQFGKHFFHFIYFSIDEITFFSHCACVWMRNYLHRWKTASLVHTHQNLLTKYWKTFPFWIIKKLLLLLIILLKQNLIENCVKQSTKNYLKFRNLRNKIFLKYSELTMKCLSCFVATACVSSEMTCENKLG